ncbi:hypothetical protein JZ751_028303 [Albula glossodonta]|uniref:Dishevelled n=1 Tax=Albula glossodonta TaxID=121402 RepID=A0A8T2NCV5_9TELE|nr:hypothetical protein JZ751_028303 [Albula glossodonta]
MKGGAVAADGRIEPGDMLLQVNDVNFENMSNDDAVRILREIVSKTGPISLTVAKCWDPSPRSYFTIPRAEPVRPIDPAAWITHTTALTGPYPHYEFDDLPLSVSKTDMTTIVKVMQLPDSGLEIRDRMWLKITIANAVIGADVVDWLYSRVEGFKDRRDARKYASSLLKHGYLRHTVNKITFSEQCYYTFGDLCQNMASLNLNEGSSGGGSEQDALAPLPPPATNPWPMGGQPFPYPPYPSVPSGFPPGYSDPCHSFHSGSAGSQHSEDHSRVFTSDGRARLQKPLEPCCSKCWQEEVELGGGAEGRGRTRHSHRSNAPPPSLCDSSYLSLPPLGMPDGVMLSLGSEAPVNGMRVRSRSQSLPELGVRRRALGGGAGVGFCWAGQLSGSRSSGSNPSAGKGRRPSPREKDRKSTGSGGSESEPGTWGGRRAERSASQLSHHSHAHSNHSHAHSTYSQTLSHRSHASYSYGHAPFSQHIHSCDHSDRSHASSYGPPGLPPPYSLARLVSSSPPGAPPVRDLGSVPPELTASRQSFQHAMGNPCEFFVDIIPFPSSLATTIPATTCRDSKRKGSRYAAVTYFLSLMVNGPVSSKWLRWNHKDSKLGSCWFRLSMSTRMEPPLSSSVHHPPSLDLNPPDSKSQEGRVTSSGLPS